MRNTRQIIKTKHRGGAGLYEAAVRSQGKKKLTKRQRAEREDSKRSKNRKTSVSFSNKEDNVMWIERPKYEVWWDMYIKIHSIIGMAIFKIRDMLSERAKFIIVGEAAEISEKIISNLINAETYLISLMDSINDRKNFIEQLNQQDKIDFLEKELKETYDKIELIYNDKTIIYKIFNDSNDRIYDREADERNSIYIQKFSDELENLNNIVKQQRTWDEFFWRYSSILRRNGNAARGIIKKKQKKRRSKKKKHKQIKKQTQKKKQTQIKKQRQIKKQTQIKNQASALNV